MRFGRNLHRHRIPEWTPFYVDYGILKRLLKFVARSTSHPREEDLIDFFDTLNRDIGRVETFYLDKFSLIERRSTTLLQRFELPPDTTHEIPANGLRRNEVEELLAGFIQRYAEIKKLQWYGKVNRDGVRRLAQKIERFASISTPSDRKFEECQFVDQGQCLQYLDWVKKSIAHLSHVLFPSDVAVSLPSLRSPRDRPCSTLSSQYEDIFAAARRDDVSYLNSTIPERLPGTPPSQARSESFLLALLQITVSSRSKRCTDRLTARLDQLRGASSADEANCIHRLVISIHRAGLLEEWQIRRGGLELPLGNAHAAERLHSTLVHLLDPSRSSQGYALVQKDESRRIPLHYAVEYGQLEATQLILDRMEEWNLFGSLNTAGTLCDIEGNSPIHLAVIGGNTEITRLLLRVEQLTGHGICTTEASNIGDTLGDLLAIALSSKFLEIVRLLGEINTNINRRSTYGGTPLHVAVQTGDCDSVKALMASGSGYRLDLNIRDETYGWTPLILACVEGHAAIVEILNHSGVDQDVQDVFGMTARDHAAFRGFLPIGDMLRGSDSKDHRSLSTRSLVQHNGWSPSPMKATKIFVNLGSLNTHKSVSTVDMTPYFSSQPHHPHPETGLSVQISAIGASGLSDVVQLPILNDMANDPWLFLTEDITEAKLVFHIFEATVRAGNGDVHIGSAVALLESLKQGVGATRESFIRDFTIPILAKGTLDLIGTITFDFVVVKPFPDARVTQESPHKIWKPEGPTQVVGHRGSGQNLPTTTRLQLGENTIQSFLSAIDIGLSYLEMTRDHIPVIYHDFLVSESGADLPPQALSFDQFMQINKTQTPHWSSNVLTATPYLEDATGRPNHHQKPRSYSLVTPRESSTRDFDNRIRHTLEYKRKGFKGNIRGDHVHGSFTTLDELLQGIPESAGLDIELKFPMLWEAENWKMDPYGVELNTFVDIILEKVYRFAGNRAIIFTSFSPELCILLAHKQRTYPVLFLNESGLFPTGDVRASNLQEAVHFAKKWSLPGVVMSSEPFVLSPPLIKYVKDAGLVCASFGILNDVPENAKMQAENGLDAIIVDNVPLIAKTLGPTCSHTL